MTSFSEFQAVLCERTAFAWWRTPPIVRMLASLDDAWEIVPSLDDAALERVQEALCESSLLNTLRDGQRRGHPFSTPSSETLFEQVKGLIPSVDAPLDLLVGSSAERRPSDLVRPHVWSRELPAGAVLPIGEGLAVTSPAFTLLELAGRLDVGHLAMALAELAGTFSAYDAPEPMARLIEELARNRLLPRIGS